MTRKIVSGHECDLPKSSWSENGDVVYCDDCDTFWSYNPNRVGTGWRRVRSPKKLRALRALGDPEATPDV